MKKQQILKSEPDYKRMWFDAYILFYATSSSEDVAKKLADKSIEVYKNKFKTK